MDDAALRCLCASALLQYPQSPSDASHVLALLTSPSETNRLERLPVNTSASAVKCTGAVSSLCTDKQMGAVVVSRGCSLGVLSLQA